MEDIAKQFKSQLKRIESKVDDVNQKLDAIHEVVQEIQSNVSNQKQFLSTYLDLIDDENTDSLTLKAFGYHQAGNLKESCDYYLRLANVSKNKTKAYLALAQIYLEMRTMLRPSAI